ncbi:hypothetical protein SCHPADRAFT_345249 [Schizopora paradoxa]|uniref:DUF6534 domain-containing protein n=1 Tax=Schizopora paradoxa TaxID=27342 RepID=A0A0H2RP61_9AGAM|nr:hypothetical protein SCHPADRAFT_345249 [Schizopora paradoxa]
MAPGLAIDLSSTYGVAYWGSVVSAVLYGCVVVQGYIYFSGYPKDSWSLKSFVGGMIVLDGVITILTAESFNDVLIKKFGNASGLLVMTDSILAEYILTWFVVTISQIFYASRVYIVNKRVWYIPATIVFLALASQAVILVLFVRLFQEHRLVTNLSKHEFVIMSCLTGSMSSAADVIATTAMCYFLSSYRSGFRRTRQFIKTLLFYTVNRGVMVAVCQITILITFAIKPTDLWWLPPHFCLSKFHVFTLVALLNTRSRMRPQLNDSALNTFSTDRSANMHHTHSRDKLSALRFAVGPYSKCDETVKSPDPAIFSYDHGHSRSSDRSRASIVHIERGETDSDDQVKVVV